MAQDKKTLSTVFLLPLTGIKKKDLEPYFVDCYMDDIRMGKTEYSDNHVFILLRCEMLKRFTDLEAWLEGLKHFKASYDVYDGALMMYIFEVPALLQADYQKIKKGQYSKISDDAKTLIKEVWGSSQQVSQILEKHPDLKRKQEEKIGMDIGDQEVWSIPDPDKELFSPEVLLFVISSLRTKGRLV